jgi:hypothetical protein
VFATFKSLIPEPRHANQPRRYVGRHRQPDPVPPIAPTAATPAVEPATESESASV